MTRVSFRMRDLRTYRPPLRPWSTMPHIPYPLRALNYLQGNRRPWIAEIRGTDEKYDYARRFLRPHRDWSETKRSGRGPVLLWYTLREGRLYEVHRHVKAHKTERACMVVRGGKVVEISRHELDVELLRRETELRVPMGVDVYTAARARIAWVFDTFERVSVSFSGGKDSTAILHMAVEEARRRRRKIGLLFIDWEAQFSLTIQHVERCFAEYADCIEPYWVSLPLTTVNACSQIEPEWVCWDERKRDLWVRQPPTIAITDPKSLPFYRSRMTFEEFAPAFGRWYAGDKLTCHLIGLRAAESLNRFRALIARKAKMEGRPWTTWLGGPAWNAYPIYDWHVQDVWTYFARESKPYNAIYDRMHAAGLTPHQMRVDEPWGDETRRGLWLYHILEPDTWAKMVARVSGSGQGALYCQERGSVLGSGPVSKPDHLTWQQFSELLLTTMPPPTAAHYRAKIAVWEQWWRNNGPGLGFPPMLVDCIDGDMSGKDKPSYRRICKVLLANDYWCKGLGFSPTKAEGSSRYQEAVKKKISKWNGQPAE